MFLSSVTLILLVMPSAITVVRVPPTAWFFNLFASNYITGYITRLKMTDDHNGSTGPTEPLLRTRPLHIWPPLISS